jgi:hypothetical protein
MVCRKSCGMNGFFCDYDLHLAARHSAVMLADVAKLSSRATG